MKIVLYGAGYIGLTLLSHLTEHEVSIITKNHHKEHALFTHLSHEKNSEKEIADVIRSADSIICTVAPSDNNYRLYTETAAFLTKVNPNGYFIYTSSIGVYGDLEGELDETANIEPKNDRTKLLFEAEQTFLQNDNSCVLRLGGIYGPHRSILARIMERGVITGSKSWPTNMVHRDDVIEAILFALTHHLKGIYNLVDCEHVSREDLYTQIADQRGIALPQWDEALPIYHGGNRKISNQKLLHEGFRMHHPTKKIEDL